MRSSRRMRAQFRPGRAWMLNAPYAGGTHLPDITVVSPVFAGRAARAVLLRRLARAPRRHRRHHAGLDAAGLAHHRGGRCRCSTTSCWSTVGAIREAALRDSLAGGPWPARNPDQNVADLKAQLAANARGAAELAALVGRAGLDTVVNATCGTSRTMPRPACARSSAGSATAGCATKWTTAAPSRSGSRSIATNRSAVVDFAGTSPQQPGNFNAPLAVCTAAVLYVFRTLVDADFPLNEGCLRPIAIRAPRGFDGEPGSARGGRRRQRGDVAMHRRCPLRRARRARRIAGHDEQPHLRRRRPPVLRDDRRRLGRGTRIRRRLRRADAHDEFAPHRSGSAGEPAPRAGARVPLPARFRAAAGEAAAATAWCA